MLCWVNGLFVEERQIQLDGITYTEVFRTYGGGVPFLASYYTQLCERLKDCGMMMTYSIVEIREVVERLNAQDDKDSVFFIHVAASPLKDELGMTVLIVRRPVEPIQFHREKSAVWSQIPYSRDALYKHLKMLHKQTEEHLAEAFLVTKNGTVAMSTTSIIFWAKDDILYTPSLRVGIDATVPRQLVIGLAKKIGYHVREDIYLPYELEEAHECFVVNPIDEIVPIYRLGAVTFAGQDGLLYERLYHAYGYEIERELRRG